MDPLREVVAIADHVGDALGIFAEDVVDLLFGLAAEGGGTDDDVAAVDGGGSAFEVVSVGEEEEGYGGGVLEVAAAGLVDEAAGSVLDVGRRRLRN